MKILYTLLLGGVSGYIASRLLDSHNSVIVNIILGIAGGYIGGFVARKLGNDPDNDGLFMNLLIAVGGAVLLIFLGRLF